MKYIKCFKTYETIDLSNIDRKIRKKIKKNEN